MHETAPGLPGGSVADDAVIHQQPELASAELNPKSD